MDIILERLAAYLGTILEFTRDENGMVMIGEGESDIPLSIKNIIIIDEANPSETFEYNDLSKKRTYHIDIRVATMVKYPESYQQIKKSIELAKLVESCLYANYTLGGLVNRIDIKSIYSFKLDMPEYSSASVKSATALSKTQGKYKDNPNFYARVRVIRLEAVKYERLTNI